MISKNDGKYNKKTYQNPQKVEKIRILNELVKENENKSRKSCSEITMYQVKSMIGKKLLRISRMRKIYWSINAKNRKYKSDNMQYSAKDILAMSNDLLKRDNEKPVCSRTIQRDIKLMNKIGLLKTETVRFGVGRGNIAFYVQNSGLSDKIIIGDLDKCIANVEFDKDQTLRILKEVEENKEKRKRDEAEIIKCKDIKSDGQETHLFKPNNNYKYKKNSRKMLSKERQKEKNGVEERLASQYSIKNSYMMRVRESSNNKDTYENALCNLETALCEYTRDYKIEHITEHFMEQFLSRYKGKVWMMMRRVDGIISDYEVIWEGRFKDKYPHKYKENVMPIKSSRQVSKRRKTIKDKEEGRNTNVREQKRELRDNIFSILLAQFTITRKTSRSTIAPIIKKFIDKLGDRLSYKGISNNFYYYSLLDILDREPNIGDSEPDMKIDTKKAIKSKSDEGRVGLAINLTTSEGFKTTKGLAIENLCRYENNYLENNTNREYKEVAR